MPSAASRASTARRSRAEPEAVPDEARLDYQATVLRRAFPDDDRFGDTLVAQLNTAGMAALQPTIVAQSGSSRSRTSAGSGRPQAPGAATQARNSCAPLPAAPSIS